MASVSDPAPLSVNRGFVVERFCPADQPVAFEDALALRMAVFVQEQAVPEDEDRDAWDEAATHWLLREAASGEAVATARLLPYQEVCHARPVAKIGRVAVSLSRRGQKLGDLLMREILTHAAAEGFEQAILDAQTRVVPFYEKLGFVAEGPGFMDAGIPHVRMRLVFSP